ncbi:transposase [Mariniblastus sp.]|nr:transposase [Mariniblastus sp.]
MFQADVSSKRRLRCSLVKLMDVELAIPNYTSLQKRAAKLQVALNVQATSGGRDIVIDGTGLKVYGESEWKACKHGASKRRTWRKVHITIDPKTSEIVTEELTGNDTHDADPVERNSISMG